MQEKVKELIGKAESLLGELKACISTAKAPESSRFKTLADGWVLDKALGIEWGPSSDSRMNFAEAQKYAAAKGGRLPTVKELRSLVDYDRHEPAIDTAFFADTKTDDWYWTSTPTAWRTDCAWCVLFNSGFVYFYSKDVDGCVRPVRASQCLIV